MKPMILAYLLLCCMALGNAQESKTPPSCEMTEAHAANYKKLNLAEQTQTFIKQYKWPVHLRNSALDSLPIKVHVIQSSNGQSDFVMDDLNVAIGQVNEHFENIGVHFFICGPINYINDDDLADFDLSKDDVIATDYAAPGHINLVLPLKLTSSSSGRPICGYTYFPWSSYFSDIITVEQSCIIHGDNASTMIHEFGHYFGLYHTHGKFNCGQQTDELVDGSNCSTTGDDLCDTPADPGLSGVDCEESLVDGSCNYKGDLTDANGQLYQPNVRNIMSYSFKKCQDFLSADQYARMAFFYDNYRYYLACSSDCTAPLPTLRSSDYSSFHMTWRNLTNVSEYSLRYRKQGDADWINRPTWESRNFLLGRALPCTTYEFQVRSNCDGGPSRWSPVREIKTEGCGDTYCYSYGLAWDNWIEKIGVNEAENHSGSDLGYSNFQDLDAFSEVILAGSRPNAIVLEPGTDEAETVEVIWQIWVDLNLNGQFEETSELVYEKTATNKEITRDVFTVSSTRSGKTRMRISMSVDGLTGPCLAEGFREVEDYSVELVGEVQLLAAQAIAQSNASCFETSDGVAFVAVSGGLKPVDVFWDNGETTDTATQLSAGVHEVLVIDRLGDSLSLRVEIGAPPALTTSVSFVDSVSCFGAMDGRALVETQGGVPGYQYLWDNEEVTPEAEALTTGLHRVKITDQNGCSIIREILVPGPEDIVLDVRLLPEDQAPFCRGDSLVLVASGAEQYEWTGPDSNTVAGETLVFPMLQLSDRGFIALSAEDADGCMADTTIELKVLDLPSVVFATTDTVFLITDTLVRLNRGLPAGGIYLGTGVVGDFFDPTLAGVGSHLIEYIYEAGNGCTNSASRTFVVTEPSTSIQAFTELVEMKLHPNPTKDVLHLTLSGFEGEHLIRVFDVTGKSIFEERHMIDRATFEHSLDLSATTAGLYTIIVAGASGRMSRRFIVAD